MNDNPDSLPPKVVFYQIIATRIGEHHGQVLRARLGSKPFLIGSGKAANILLDNPAILPVQIRLLSSTTGQVLLTNLGEPEHVLMNSEPVPTHVPTYWKPGVPVTVADFDLQLVTLVEGEGEEHLERVRPAVITQASEVAPESDSGVDFIIDWGDSPDQESGLEAALPHNNTVLFGKNPNDDEALVDTREGWRLESPSQESIAQPPPDLPEVASIPDPPTSIAPEMPHLDESASLPTEAMPTELNRALGGQSPYLEIPGGNETLPKNWQSAGKLSAQLTNDSVNLVAGERVRIPVSVRNESADPMQLRVLIAGLPNDWAAMLEDGALLLPGEIKSVDVILETKTPFDQAYLDVLLRMHDQLAPETYLTLPLRLNFKITPNIVGRLSPTHPGASQTAYLNLHNHTRVTITTLIAGHSELPDLHIVPAQAQLELLPGQNIEIPVHIHVLHRPWLRATQQHFSVSVRHGNRAALDYPGVARVAPRIPLRVLLLVVLLAVLAVTWRIFGNNVGAVVLNTPTAASELPAIIKQTVESTAPQETDESTVISSPRPSVTRTPWPRVTSTTLPTATPRPSNTPQPTETLALTEILPTLTWTPAQAAPLDDPRPESCVMPVPDGWKPYTVQAGDRVFRLAVTYATTVEEVARVNCLADPRLLQVGQVLLLPIP